MTLKIPGEIVKKVEMANQAINTYEALIEDLKAFFYEAMDGAYMGGFAIVDKPMGHEQNDGEYCDQSTGYLEDDYSGTYYYPIGDGRYIAIEYCM